MLRSVLARGSCVVGSPAAAVMGGNDRLRRVSHHVGLAAFPSEVAGAAIPEPYHLAVLKPSDAADCVGLMPGVDMWRTTIEDAARSWGYRVHGGTSELVACAFLYIAAGDSPSAGHCTVSNVLTSEDHRRRGLAKSLMLELLGAANGRPTSLFASAMGAPLYEQLGFKRVDTAQGFRCERQFAPDTATAAARAAGVAVSVTAAPTAAEIAEVGALDSAMFGGNRRALLQSALGRGSDAMLAVARDTSGKVAAFAASAGPNAFSHGAQHFESPPLHYTCRAAPSATRLHLLRTVDHRLLPSGLRSVFPLRCRCASVRACGRSHGGGCPRSHRRSHRRRPVSRRRAVACGVNSAARAAFVCSQPVGPGIQGSSRRGVAVHASERG